MVKKKLYILSLMLSVVATAIGSGIMGVLLNEIVRGYSLEVFQEGFMSSCISAGALFALFTGIVLRGRIHKYQFISWGGLLMSAMLLLKSIPVSFSTFLALCFVMGIGMGVMDSFQTAFLADLLPENTAKGLGMLHGIFGVGGFALPLILHRLLGSFSWRSIFRMLGIFCLVLIVQFILSTEWMKKEKLIPNKLEKTSGLAQIKNFGKDSYFLVLLVCMFLGAASQNGILVWTVRYVSASLGSLEIAPVCLSIFWIASTVSRIFAPYLPFLPMQIIATGGVISGIAWGLGIWSETPYGVLGACAAAGLASGCCMPMLLNEGAVFNRNNTGLTTSVLMIVKTAGQILCPIFISHLKAAGGVEISMLMIAVLFVADGIAAWAMLRMKRRRSVDS